MVCAQVGLSLRAESTWLRRGAEECRFTLGDVDTFLEPFRARDRAAEVPVRVGGQPGVLIGDSYLEWWTDHSSASVSCESAGGPDRLFEIARSVRYEIRTVRVPIGLPTQPVGVLEPELVVEADSTTWLLTHRLYFTAAFTAPGPDASCDRPAPPTTSLTFSRSPAVGPPEHRRVTTPTGAACAELRWRTPSGPIRDLAESQLDELIRQLMVAPDPADPAAWFDAQDVLPPR